jgi:hemerythrin-like domain-containing protein
MSAVENLFEEHRLIEQVISALERCVTGLSTDNENVRCDLMRFVTFFREFADLLHHEKEEEFLMPALSEAGLRWEEGIMLQIRKEHDFERHLLQTLRHLALQNGSWSQNDCRRVVEISTRFINFMRNHIALEDSKLHHLISEALSASQYEVLDSKLKKFDEKRVRSGESDLLINLGTDLISKYLPASP